MIYLAQRGGVLGPEYSSWYGVIRSPRSRSLPPRGRYWAMDNDCFTGRFDVERWRLWLHRYRQHRDRCLFVTAPDVLCDALATMYQFRLWGGEIAAMGWPVAFVAQDGQELYPLPPEMDVVFIGGSTEWKLGPGARAIIAEAKRRGLWVHVGRVNTQRRIRYLKTLGVDSVDGTTLAYAPTEARLVLDSALAQPALLEWA